LRAHLNRSCDVSPTAIIRRKFAPPLRLGNCTITNNLTGVANFGGTLQSFKNNQFAANGSDGTPITAVPRGTAN
jgi:hypothetical protein